MKKIIPEQYEYYCDKCKRLIYTGDREGLCTVNINTRSIRDAKFDLCTECFYLLKNHLQNLGLDL